MPMQTTRVMDQFDLEAEREAAAMSRFRKEIGDSIGRIGTPKNKARQGRKVVDDRLLKMGFKPGVFKPA